MMIQRLDSPAARRRAGFTIVELMVVVFLLFIVLGSVAMVGGANDRAYHVGSIASHLESQIAIATDRVADELKIAGVDTLAPDPVQGVGASSIQYAQATGFDPASGQVVWTPLRQLAFEYEAGELDDGIDNNGNDLIDEGVLVLTTDVGTPTEHRRVITRWVAELYEGELENGVDDNGNGLIDERGFFLERAGETVIVRLMLQRRTADGAFLDRTSQTSMRLRNRLGE